MGRRWLLGGGIGEFSQQIAQNCCIFLVNLIKKPTRSKLRGFHLKGGRRKWLNVKILQGEMYP